MKRHGENRRRFGCGAGCWGLVRWRGQSRGMRGDMRRLSDMLASVRKSCSWKESASELTVFTEENHECVVVDEFEVLDFAALELNYDSLHRSDSVIDAIENIRMDNAVKAYYESLVEICSQAAMEAFLPSLRVFSGTNAE